MRTPDDSRADAPWQLLGGALQVHAEDTHGHDNTGTA